MPPEPFTRFTADGDARACAGGDAIRAMRASFPRTQATIQALASWLSLFALQAQAGVLVDREEIVEAR